MNPIAARIKEMREWKGWTQDMLADAAGMNRVTIAKYESGRIEPKSASLSKLAAALGVSPEILLGMGDRAMEEEDQELWRIREDLRRNPELRTLHSLMRGATKKELKQMETIIRALRGSNDENTD